MKYTVAEFAKKIGKSKAEVYAMCKSLLLDYTSIEQGKKLIDDAALALFAAREEAQNNTEEQQNYAEPVRNSAEEAREEEPAQAPAADGTISKDEVIAYLKSRVEKLEAQVEAKDDFIRELTLRYTETVQTNNLITARQQEQIVLLEAAAKENQAVQEAAAAQAAEEAPTEQPAQEKQRRPSLFARLFNRKGGPTA